jgi:hypothetical protein
MLCCCLIELAREVSVDKYELLLTGVLQWVEEVDGWLDDRSDGPSSSVASLEGLLHSRIYYNEIQFFKLQFNTKV